MRVDRDDADRSLLLLAGPEQPEGHVVGVSAGNDVQEPAAVEIDEARRIERVARPRRGKHLVLVDAEGRDTDEAFFIVDEWGAVPAHRVHRASPRHAEIPRNRRHAVRVSSDSRADLKCGTPRQALLDAIALFGEAPLRTVALATDEAALLPHEPHRSPSCWQVADLDHRASMSGRDHPTGRTSNDVARRLDEHEALAVLFARR